MKNFTIAVFVALAWSISLTSGVACAEQKVFIQNRLSKKCIDVRGQPGLTNEAPLQLWSCEWSGKGPGGSPTDQKWIITNGGFIKNAIATDKCIDVQGRPGLSNEAPLQLWDCEYSGTGPDNTPTDQRWIITPGGLIKNVLAGAANKCIDVKGTLGKEDGAPLQLWDCEFSGGSNDTKTDQQWDLVPAKEP